VISESAGPSPPERQGPDAGAAGAWQGPEATRGLTRTESRAGPGTASAASLSLRFKFPDHNLSSL
jgi:hypothetical protein